MGRLLQEVPVLANTMYWIGKGTPQPPPLELVLAPYWWMLFPEPTGRPLWTSPLSYHNTPWRYILTLRILVVWQTI